MMRNSDKEDLEIIKIREEIEKIKAEKKQISKSGRNFLLGNICIPLVVSLGTLFTISRTGYFNAWQTKNENAEHDFKLRKDSLHKNLDSIIRVKDSMSSYVDSLKQEINNKNKINSHIDSVRQLMQNNALTNNQKINILSTENTNLALKNASLEKTIDSLNKIRRMLSINALDFDNKLQKVIRAKDSEMSARGWEHTYALDKWVTEAGYYRNELAASIKAYNDTLRLLRDSLRRMPK